MNESLRELTPEVVFHLAVRRWDLLLLLPLLTVLAAGLVWQITPSQYETTARLLIQDQQTVNPFSKEMVEEWSAEQRMPLVESIFESRDTSEQVLRKVGRLRASATPEETNEAVAEFQEAFEVIGLGGELILIKVRGKTPLEAYNAATALIETFTDEIVQPQRATVRASGVFFQERLEQLRGKPDDVALSIAPHPESKTADSLKTRKALAEAEARLAAVQQAVELHEDDLREGSPRAKRLKKSLAEAKRRVYALKRTFGRSHPALLEAKKRVRTLERAIDEEHASHRTVPGSTGGDAKAGESREHRALLVRLKRADAEVALLRQRLLIEDLSLFAESSPVWPIEDPVMPTQRLGPPFLLVLVGALFAGLILALLAIAFFAAFDDSLRGERELAEAIGAPSLGRMPRGGT